MISLYDSALQKQKWKAERVLSPRAAPLGKFGNVQYAPPDDRRGPQVERHAQVPVFRQGGVDGVDVPAVDEPARRAALRDQGSAALSTATWRTCWDA